MRERTRFEHELLDLDPRVRERETPDYRVVDGQTIQQEPKLSEILAKNLTPKEEQLAEMNPRTLGNMSNSERRKWYIDKMGKYWNQVEESASNNKVPMQLLATVVLNELGDIIVILPTVYRNE